MDHEATPTTSAKAPPLNSDQLNYLIWRYLQESGYGEAAVKLQRDWNVDAEALPFAKHIQGQALVKLVQKGLKYHHLQLTIDENGRSTRQLMPSMFFFGPESEKQIPEPREPNLQPSSSRRVPSPEPPLAVPRKRVGENGPGSTSEGTSLPASKRSRKPAKETTSERNGARKSSTTANSNVPNGLEADVVNGHPPSVQDARSPSGGPGLEEEHTAINGMRQEDRMDVDSDADQHMDAPAEIVSPLVPTLSKGESVGVQVAPAKAADLSSSTTILNLDNEKQISQALWKPHDDQILSVRGVSVCGVWGVQQPQNEFQELVSVESASGLVVTAMAWEPNGAALAVATCSQNGGELHLYEGQELGLLETLPASQRAIIKLQWHQAGMRLVGIAPFDDQNSASSIMLWDLSDAKNSAGPMSQSVPETLEDVDCTLADGSGFVFATGGEAVYQCRAFNEVEVEQKYSSLPSGHDRWSFIRCSWRSQNDTLLVAASTDSGRLWLPDRDVKKDAHQAAITALQIRPQHLNGYPALSTSEFATSSEDGTIKIWQYDRPTNTISTTSKLIVGYPQLLKTLAYSPDGFFLAGASYSTVRIWNAEYVYNQMANWKGESTSWKGDTLKEDDDLVSNGAMSSVNGDGTGAAGLADHSLAWGSDGSKLAFALGSQVALINFRR
ncbi:hypothetical protein DV738_g4573, partial [Chaetothyriales sp. CBS 135597]